jgi:hypothetical protein
MDLNRLSTSAFHRPTGCEFYVYGDSLEEPLLAANAYECFEPAVIGGRCMRALASGYSPEQTARRLDGFIDLHGGDEALRFRPHPSLDLLVPVLGERLLAHRARTEVDELALQRATAAVILDGLMEPQPIRPEPLRRQQ